MRSRPRRAETRRDRWPPSEYRRRGRTEVFVKTRPDNLRPALTELSRVCLTLKIGLDTPHPRIARTHVVKMMKISSTPPTIAPAATAA
eukprot:5854970-Prymnesium_polylepis.1